MFSPTVPMPHIPPLLHWSPSPRAAPTWRIGSRRRRGRRSLSGIRWARRGNRWRRKKVRRRGRRPRPPAVPPPLSAFLGIPMPPLWVFPGCHGFPEGRGEVRDALILLNAMASLFGTHPSGDPRTSQTPSIGTCVYLNPLIHPSAILVAVTFPNRQGRP